MIFIQPATEFQKGIKQRCYIRELFYDMSHAAAAVPERMSGKQVQYLHLLTCIRLYLKRS